MTVAPKFEEARIGCKRVEVRFSFLAYKEFSFVLIHIVVYLLFRAGLGRVGDTDRHTRPIFNLFNILNIRKSFFVV